MCIWVLDKHYSSHIWCIEIDSKLFLYSTGDVFEDALGDLADGATTEQGKEGGISSNTDAGHPYKDDAQMTAPASTGIKPSQKPEEKVTFGLTNQDFLTMADSQTQKLRRASSKSEAGSDRSTPEIIPSDTPFWDGNPKLVGNIVCIIPKSAMPYVPLTSTSLALSLGKEEPENTVTKRKIKSTSGLQNNNIEVVRTISLEEKSLSKPLSNSELKPDEETESGPGIADPGTNKRKIQDGLSRVPALHSKGNVKILVSR